MLTFREFTIEGSLTEKITVGRSRTMPRIKVKGPKTIMAKPQQQKLSGMGKLIVNRMFGPKMVRTKTGQMKPVPQQPLFPGPKKPSKPSILRVKKNPLFEPPKPKKQKQIMNPFMPKQQAQKQSPLMQLLNPVKPKVQKPVKPTILNP